MARITKAILPVAGFGTRFLPATKAQPKEMLPLVDKPVIQYIVEEAVASGIRDILFVTGQNKRAIEDHFDRSGELEELLEERGRTEALNAVRQVSKLARIAYVRQPKPLGDGDALLQAAAWVGNEPFAVLFGDDVVANKTPCLKQLISAYERYREPIVALQRIKRAETKSYGIASGKIVAPRHWSINTLVEKPEPKYAPSTLAIVGRYVLTPDVLETLADLRGKHRARDGELRIIDALKVLLKKRGIIGVAFEGKRFDCGSPRGFIAANIHFAYERPELKSSVRESLRALGKALH